MSAFGACYSLQSIIIPSSVNVIEEDAFGGCLRLESFYFEGNAPRIGSHRLRGAASAILYYLPGTAGWDTLSIEHPLAPWVRPEPVILSGTVIGRWTNGFGFTISWATNLPVVVEASTNLAEPAWSPISTNNLVNGMSHFTNSGSMSHPRRFFRLRSS
jgi:hypothetical protein